MNEPLIRYERIERLYQRRKDTSTMAQNHLTSIQTKKQCSKCNLIKLLSAFSKSGGRLKSRCKECTSVDNKIYAQKTKKPALRKELFTIEHLTLADISRVFHRITITAEMTWSGTPCWIWTGSMFTGKYGRIDFHEWGSIPTHRLMYAWLVGPIPMRQPKQKTPNLDHLCKRTACCNPNHLELVPPRTNILRGTAPTARNAAKTHCPSGHPYNKENTIWDAPTHRSCRACRQEKAQRQRKASDYKEKMKVYQDRYFKKLGQDVRRARWRDAYYRLKERKLRNGSSDGE